MPSTVAEAQPVRRDIAVGVAVDRHGRLLIARRRPDTPGAGCWEFPGGKQEVGETIFECLARELAEEVGITGLQGTPVIRFSHDLGAAPVRLHVWRIHDWTGMPGGREGQSIRWVAPAECRHIEWLPATRVILAALALPRHYLITPSVRRVGEREWLAGLDKTLNQGIRLLRFRDPGLDDDDYRDMARQLIERAHASGAKVLLDRDADMAKALAADGLHWSTARFRAHGRRPVPEDLWFAVSTHDAMELTDAVAVGADFATLSPVAASATHPGAEPLGWPGFEARRADLALPVYALGGMMPSDCQDAIAHNAQGISGIGGLWSGHRPDGN